jgi:hypothetical protein
MNIFANNFSELNGSWPIEPRNVVRPIKTHYGNLKHLILAAQKCRDLLVEIWMKSLIFVFHVLLTVNSLSAGTPKWQPSPGHTQVPIWPGSVPDAQPVAGPEDMKPVEKPLVAGRPWVEVENVSQPTMTVYSPKGKNTGAAMVVFPGGGYKILAIDLEGTEIADWLMSKGITCVLLKYRVPFSGPYMDERRGRVYPKAPMALEDAQQTVGLVRFHAAQWHIDPDKIVIALKNAEVPVEMHLYAQGGHAFGLRPTECPITRWPELVETWLRTIGMIAEPAH